MGNNKKTVKTLSLVLILVFLLTSVAVAATLKTTFKGTVYGGQLLSSSSFSASTGTVKATMYYQPNYTGYVYMSLKKQTSLGDWIPVGTKASIPTKANVSGSITKSWSSVGSGKFMVSYWTNQTIYNNKCYISSSIYDGN